jgi:hypothetical protein
VDCGEFYTYNPNREDFMQGWDLFRNAPSSEVAALILTVLAKMAAESGVSEADLGEWVSQQRMRWINEKRWDALDG